jgi:hypothetical protein
MLSKTIQIAAILVALSAHINPVQIYKITKIHVPIFSVPQCFGCTC